MTWPDVIRSVRERIHDERAQDAELRAKWRERMPVAGRQQFRITLHCAACSYDSVLVTDVSQADWCRWYCLHCGADDPEVVSIDLHPRPTDAEKVAR